MVFPVVMQRCKSWNIKKAECWRTDTFKLWCWRKLFRVLWTARRSNPSILMEINLEYSLEGLVLKLKLQYFGPLMQATDSLKRPWCWERLRARGEGDNRGWDGWMASPTKWTWMGLDGLRESVMDRKAWHAVVHRVAESDMTERLNWTDMYIKGYIFAGKQTFCKGQLAKTRVRWWWPGVLIWPYPGLGTFSKSSLTSNCEK